MGFLVKYTEIRMRKVLSFIFLFVMTNVSVVAKGQNKLAHFHWIAMC